MWLPLLPPPPPPADHCCSTGSHCVVKVWERKRKWLQWQPWEKKNKRGKGREGKGHSGFLGCPPCARILHSKPIWYEYLELCRSGLEANSPGFQATAFDNTFYPSIFHWECEELDLGLFLSSANAWLCRKDGKPFRFCLLLISSIKYHSIPTASQVMNAE